MDEVQAYEGRVPVAKHHARSQIEDSEARYMIYPKESRRMEDEEKVHPEERNRRLSLIVAAVIAIAFSIYILSLPIFPSTDGPVHLYYASILKDLLFTRGAHFGEFYYIKHLLPPYALYYYLLILLSYFMSFPDADKVVICLYIFSFVFSLRYLARSIGPNGDAMALAVTPLLFSWSLAMGFVNFSLSTTLAFWAIGLWIRNERDPRPKKRIAFVVLAYVGMLTHPVPLLFIAGFCLVELIVRLVRPGALESNGGGRILGTTAHSRALRADLFTYVMALTTFGYVKLFTVSHILKQDPGDTIQTRIVLSLKALRTLVSVSPLYGAHEFSYLLFHLLVRVLLVVFLALAVLQFRRHGSEAGRGISSAYWTQGKTCALIAGLVLVLMPLVPPNFNGAAYFAWRLHPLIWISAAIAAAGYRSSERLIHVGAAGFALVLTGLTLVMAHAWMNPVARRLSDASMMPPMGKHRLGLYLSGETHRAPDLSYDPNPWNAASLFRRSNTVMCDSPWMDQTTIPIGAKSTLDGTCFTTSQSAASDLRKELLSNPDLARSVFNKVDFVVFTDSNLPASVTTDPILLNDTSNPQHPWGCRAYGWYSFCERRGIGAATAAAAEELRSQ